MMMMMMMAIRNRVYDSEHGLVVRIHEPSLCTRVAHNVAYLDPTKALIETSKFCPVIHSSAS